MLTTIFMLVYEGFELLDMAGPVSVFGTANKLSKQPLYNIRLISCKGGLISDGAGLQSLTETAEVEHITSVDTLLVAGAEAMPLESALNEKQLIEFIARGAAKARRLGSICSGAFLLARAKQLDGKTCTTHWIASNALKRLASNTHVRENALYIEDGDIWTSAGVTTGIDMALAMLAKDHGSRLMGEVARHLVVYSHRPGNQSQFSDYLTIQLQTSSPIKDAINWLHNHLQQPIRVAQLAEQANMSERSFYRRFCDEVGKTPAKYIEQCRMEKARYLIQHGMPIKLVHHNLGYRSESAFRQMFERQYGMTPQTYKLLHQVNA